MEAHCCVTAAQDDVSTKKSKVKEEEAVTSESDDEDTDSDSDEETSSGSDDSGSSDEVTCLSPMWSQSFSLSRDQLHWLSTLFREDRSILKVLNISSTAKVAPSHQSASTRRA